MPAKFTICPDGEHRLIEDCLKHCPREEGRCLSLPTLVAVYTDRVWSGTPSTTQCLNGTRMEYLKITEDYSVNPMSRAFALLGTRHHQYLESIAKKLNVLAEERLGENVSGMFDLLEPDENSDIERYILTDYKTWGSFKVARAMGIVKAGKKPDPSGALYKSSGKWGKAGTPKMVDVFIEDPTKADLVNESLQLNKYRLDIETAGFPVSKMRIQATVRDGGTYIAESRGLFLPIYMIHVPLLRDNEVENYFDAKAGSLLYHLENKTLPTMCSFSENWEGRRCAGFCDVWPWCDAGIAAMKGKEQNADQGDN